MKNKEKGRLPPFVPLLKDTMDSPAWKAMSHGARSLNIAIKRRYNLQTHNNGKLYLSQRKAAEELGSTTNQIGRWFQENQHYGFLVQTKPGGLGVYGKGKAPCWRLTEVGWMKDPPTRDFERWDGALFSKHQAGGDHLKKQNPVPENGDRVSRKTGTVVSRKRGTVHGTSVPEKGDKGRPQSVPEKGDKSIFTTGVVRGRGELEQRESERQILELPLMTVLTGGKQEDPDPHGRTCAHCGRNGSCFNTRLVAVDGRRSGCIACAGVTGRPRHEPAPRMAGH